MSMYKLFKTDESLETKGIVIDYGAFRVTIARAGGKNQRYARVLEAKSKPYRRAIQTETMDPDKAQQLLLETFAEAVVLNWETKVDDQWQRGIEPEGGGDLLPFNAENVILTFQKLPDLFQDLHAQANKVALFREGVLEQEAGN